MYALTNPSMRYAWGSPDAIPALMGVEPDGRPLAEVWMGAHPASPSMVSLDGEQVRLDELIARSPQTVFGAETAREQGPRLPFMAKLLAAGRPLSLQVHPNKEQAVEGYRCEDAAGLALTDPRRSYRDRSDKPEMLYALSPFEMLAGFRPLDVSRELLAGLEVDELTPVVDALRGPGEALRSALTLLLCAPGEEQRALTRAVVDSARERRRTRPGYQLVDDLAKHHPHDVGVVVSLFLNRVRLEPGEAVFVPPGMIHSYLDGLGLEILAASDNVLRAGLTEKHVDPVELLRLVTFSPGEPPRLQPKITGEVASFVAPVPDFALWTYRPGPRDASGPRDAVAAPSAGARIAVCCAGRATLTCGDERLELGPGQAAFIPDGDGPLRVVATGLLAVVLSRP